MDLFSNNPNVAGVANALSPNNALDLFPTTTGPQQAQFKLQRLLYATTSRGATEIQSTLARSLFDDAVEYMSTLDMNRAASYTFGHRNSYGQNGTVTNALGGGTHGESIAGEMWELVIDLTLSRFVRHSVLALAKTLHLIRHVLLHGSEVCVTNVELLYRIETALGPLRNLNTALVEQQMVERILNNEGRASGIDNDVVLNMEGIGQQLSQFGTKATAAMLKLRGGSVDKGHPVREAAGKLYEIVMDRNRLVQLRNQQGGGGDQFGQQSLVPIGSANQVGYITDDARLRLLQQKMAAEERELKQKEWQEQQKMKQTRSNLAGASARDGFGGGYASSAGAGTVVGAANSLEDMIKSAQYELEQHKNKGKKKMAALKKGYSDDPYSRARQLEELQRTDPENDPEYKKKEKALQDALEYLQEMQREEQEKVGDLLEGDLMGGGSGGSAAMTSGGMSGGGADLLGFENNATSPPADIFGGTAANMGGGGGGTMDLLGFDSAPSGHGNVAGAGGAFSAQPPLTNPTVSKSNIENMAGGFDGGMSNNNDMRPSLVTGGHSMQQQAPANVVAQPELDEEAEAENTRKMQMAAGLFAGVVPNGARKPVMQTGSSLDTSALDDLIPVTDTALGSMPTAPSNSGFSVNGPISPPTQSSTSDAFGMGPMGGSSGVGIPPAPAMAPPPPMGSSVFDGNGSSSASLASSDPFGMGPMGGSGGNGGAGIPPGPPPVAPPPPPMEPPPPPPPAATMAAASPGGANNPLGGNQTVEQMQEMIKQQQAQMNQMMQMMQQMQMQGGNNAGNPGGWQPPT